VLDDALLVNNEQPAQRHAVGSQHAVSLAAGSSG
jgi:hypothetical protein